MSGRVGQGVPGRTDWTVIPAGVNLNYLGLIENKITAQVDVAETFSILSGEWKATLTKISGESAILCFPGDPGCKQTFPKDSSQLVASPPGGIVKSAGRRLHAQHLHLERPAVLQVLRPVDSVQRHHRLATGASST